MHPNANTEMGTLCLEVRTQRICIVVIVVKETGHIIVDDYYDRDIRRSLVRSYDELLIMDDALWALYDRSSKI